MHRWLFSLLALSHTVRGNKATRQTSKSASRQFRPSLELLEDRTTPSTLSTITSNFNGTAIPAGDTLWFNSVMKVSGLGSSPVTIHVTNQVIAFSASGTNYTLNVPDSNITFSPANTTGTTSFDAGQNAWVSNLPSTFSGNAFLGGFGFHLSSALPGGINPVTWSGNFSTDTAGIKLNWQWSTAVYTHFSPDNNALNVKPLDSNSATAYKNSDHAGTPEAFKSFVVGGARGGGGSNWTGSYSATATVIPTVDSGGGSSQQQPATISGYAYDSVVHVGIAGVTITLTGTDVNGHAVTMTTTTDGNGFYQFTNLIAGSYTLSAGAVDGYDFDHAVAGTDNGATDGTGGTSQITDISLNSGDNGINYDFYFLMSSAPPPS